MRTKNFDNFDQNLQKATETLLENKDLEYTEIPSANGMVLSRPTGKPVRTGNIANEEETNDGFFVCWGE